MEEHILRAGGDQQENRRPARSPLFIAAEAQVCYELMFLTHSLCNKQRLESVDVERRFPPARSRSVQNEVACSFGAPVEMEEAESGQAGAV